MMYSLYKITKISRSCCSFTWYFVLAVNHFWYHSLTTSCYYINRNEINGIFCRYWYIMLWFSPMKTNNLNCTFVINCWRPSWISKRLILRSYIITKICTLWVLLSICFIKTIGYFEKGTIMMQKQSMESRNMACTIYCDAILNHNLNKKLSFFK